MPDPTIDRYLNGDYADKNPDWDSADSPWKATKIAALLQEHGREPASVVEIGCGSGGVLVALRKALPRARFAGFDIAPGAQRFWSAPEAGGIRFVLGDYLAMEEPVPELTLVLDVLEHLGNPWDFLERLRARSQAVIFHFPLDLSSLSVLRETPLLYVRHKVGHLHYYTKGLALRLLEESGFEVLDARFTGAAFDAPHRSLKTRLAGLLRRVVYALNRDLGARLLGGETLLVLARPRAAA